MRFRRPHAQRRRLRATAAEGTSRVVRTAAPARRGQRRCQMDGSPSEQTRRVLPRWTGLALCLATQLSAVLGECHCN